MRKTKRRFEFLPFFDRTGLERHFAQMAQKGWLIQRMSNYGWTYRRIEPQKLHFSISYYPKASEFDPEPRAEQQEFLDFCAHTGWQLACTWAQMQVFYNDRENPIPIETDPSLEVEIIHDAMNKTFLPGQLFLLVMALLILFLQLIILSGNVIVFLADPLKLFGTGCWMLVVAMTTADIVVFYRWLRRAEAAAEQGEFLPSFSTAVFQKACMAVLGLLILGLIWNLLGSSNTMLKFVLLAMSGYMVVLNLLSEGIKRLGKRLKLSRKVNRAVTFIMTFLLAYGMVGGITYVTMSLNQDGFFDQEEETYTYNGETWVHYRDELPLTIGDFMEEPCDYVCKLDTAQTPFLARQEAYQRPRYGEPNRREIPDLEYEVVTVKMPFLYDACKKQLLKQLSSFRSYEPIDPAPWGAQEAYKLIWEDSLGDSGQYLLCYEETLVEISFEWEPTQPQMTIVGQKLISQ